MMSPLFAVGATCNTLLAREWRQAYYALYFSRKRKCRLWILQKKAKVTGGNFPPVTFAFSTYSLFYRVTREFIRIVIDLPAASGMYEIA